MRALTSSGSASSRARTSAADLLQQFAGQVLVQIGVDQVGEQAEEGIGQVAAGRRSERLHSSLTIACRSLSCPPMSAGRRRSPRRRGDLPANAPHRPAGRFRGTCAGGRRLGTLTSRRGRDFDLPRPGNQPEQPAAADLAGVQHGRVGAQVPPHHGQRLVHRRRSIGFDFHDRLPVGGYHLRIVAAGSSTIRCFVVAMIHVAHRFDAGVAGDFVVAQHDQLRQMRPRSSASRPRGSAG